MDKYTKLVTLMLKTHYLQHLFFLLKLSYIRKFPCKLLLYFVRECKNALYGQIITYLQMIYRYYEECTFSWSSNISSPTLHIKLDKAMDKDGEGFQYIDEKFMN